MKMYLFKKVIFNCETATRLSLKRDAGEISFVERIKLLYHLLFCIYCRRFVKQSHLMDERMSRLDQDFFKNPPHKLSAETMDKLQEEINKSL